MLYVLHVLNFAVTCMTVDLHGLVIFSSDSFVCMKVLKRSPEVFHTDTYRLTQT